MELELFQCNREASIREAMEKIEKNSIKTIFAVDNKGCLCGVATDGDIRRALLDGYGLNDKLSTILHDKFYYASVDDDLDSIASKFSDIVEVIPIVDADMHLVNYVEYHVNSHLPLAIPQLNGNEYRYLQDAFLSTWISSTGKYVTRFEEMFSDYCETSYGVATSNGTVALHLALTALEIGAGDEVIVPNLTFAATINAVLYTGATPVIVDVDPISWCIDPAKIREALSEKTKAIIPVHIYGQPCNMTAICDIAKENDLYIIEDCAEAHGARWNGRKVGSFGDISCFSFYGNKVITTGEGGMCVTNNAELNEKMRLLRDHGMSKERRYYHQVVGFNYRMTNMQAAIGVAQLEHIDDILSWRRKLEDDYRRVFSKDDRIILQRRDLEGSERITWLVSAMVEKNCRDIVINKLKENAIDVRPFFIPLSEMEIYKSFAKGEYPVSCDLSNSGINLPTTSEVKSDMIDKIFKLIVESLDEVSK